MKILIANLQYQYQIYKREIDEAIHDILWIDEFPRTKIGKIIRYKPYKVEML